MAATTIVHARLDASTLRILQRLRRRTGLRDSDLLRKALRALDAAEVSARGQEVVGLGAFASGLPDLGSDERHLQGFGRS